MTPAPAYRIERVAAPRFTTGEVPADREMIDWTGDQGWGWAVPLTYQVLASPRSYRPFPAAPSPSGSAQAAAIGYWSALLHLLIYSFGWARPDLGLRWWFDAGRPVDDPRLRLMSETWQSDGHLDEFAAWIWTTQKHADIHQLAELAEKPVSSRPVDVDRRWVASVEQQVAPGVPSPLGGGWDPLHLSQHCDWPLEQPPSPPRVIHSSTKERRAVLIVDSLVGWYRALATTNLPDLDARSWRVDVVATPVGHLGTFRRSRETGLWFAGKHRFHRPGN